MKVPYDMGDEGVIYLPDREPERVKTLEQELVDTMFDLRRLTERAKAHDAVAAAELANARLCVERARRRIVGPEKEGA